jgi:D-3-phosphoglycerate dehydrogenase / 2-oxoglutarate reductase
MYKVFVADELALEGIAALKEYPEIEIDFSPGLTVEEAIPHVTDADAIIVRSATKLKGRLLDAASKCKVIGRAGIGVDNIDLDVSTERGIVVLNTPDANATTTAELAIAHIFSLSRKLPEADRSVRSGKWQRNEFVGVEVSGKTIGIVGFGTIGRLLAERCLGLKMKVVAFDPFVTQETFEEHGVEKKEIDELIGVADYISLHCPVTDGTRGLFSREKLLAMKPGSRIINCARGGLIDEKALCDIVSSGHLAGAALDVFEQEPPIDSPLLAVSNIQFTPHLGASTEEAQTAVGVEISHQIAAFLLKGKIINSVNVPSIDPDNLKQMNPYMELAHKLGKVLCQMVEGALSSVEIGVFGEASKFDAHPIASASMVGLLCQHHAVPVNQINALHLARRQGINVTKISSADSKDYLSLIRITAQSSEQTIILEGAIFDQSRPRLVKINGYEIESPLEGHLLITKHADEPGVVGRIGEALGKENINISRMQVGVAEGAQLAIAILAISDALSERALENISKIEAVDKVIQVLL